jgi:hypothetical protein
MHFRENILNGLQERMPNIQIQSHNAGIPARFCSEALATACKVSEG